MTKSETMAKLLEISENSYFRWKKKDHKILIELIEKYFTNDELVEFLNTGKIEKLEILNSLLYSCSYKFYDFYFNYLGAEKDTRGKTFVRSYFLYFLIHTFSKSDNSSENKLLKDLEEFDSSFEDIENIRSYFIKELTSTDHIYHSNFVSHSENLSSTNYDVLEYTLDFNLQPKEIIQDYIIKNYKKEDYLYLDLNIRNNFSLFTKELYTLNNKIKADQDSSLSFKIDYSNLFNSNQNIKISDFAFEIFILEFNSVLNNIPISTSKSIFNLICNEYKNIKSTECEKTINILIDHVKKGKIKTPNFYLKDINT